MGETHTDTQDIQNATSVDSVASKTGRIRRRVGRVGIGGRVLVNVCRFILGLTFIFSGYVKAVDPLGTQYKLHDYLLALNLARYVPDVVTLGCSIALSALEFSLGIFILFAIRRHLCALLSMTFMIVMTLITVWIAIANPVSDCGCFGDAVHLTNTQTLLKNVVLLACAVVLWWRPEGMVRFISKANQWIAINFTILFIVITSIYCLYRLPIFDFRPYHIGQNIKQGMAIPAGAEQPQFETTFIMRKNGKTQEFTLKNYPDSTWQFVDSKTVQTKAGYVPPIHDFSIQTAEGDDLTDAILLRKGYTFLLISPHLSTADDTNFGAIDQIYEYAEQEKVPFYCLTASTDKEIAHWQNITGAEYPFYLTDETTLKTIVRSNPGLLLLHNGTIIGKWSHNHLPDSDMLRGPLSELPIGQMNEASVGKTVMQVVLWFFVPLLLLTFADRTWAWSQYVKRKARVLERWNMRKNEQANS
jgi:hypothetical protein